MHALRRARHGVPRPNPPVFGVNLGLVLFGMHAADAMGLLRGASGPFMGHCAMKIEKITTILISGLDLAQNHVFQNINTRIVT